MLGNTVAISARSTATDVCVCVRASVSESETEVFWRAALCLTYSYSRRCVLQSMARVHEDREDRYCLRCDDPKPEEVVREAW
jgi:collagenase-like PrtC family protease